MHGVSSLLFPIYNLGFGLDVALVGLAQAIPRAIDMFLDPMIGHISDNTRSRWGRRRPYVLVGAIGCAAFFSLFWMPPSGLGQTGLFLFLLFVSLAYYCFYSVFAVPYTALGFEQTEDSTQRTGILAWRMYFGLAAGLVVPWLYKLCFLPALGGDETVGVIYVAIGVSVLIAVFGAIPAILCKEHPRATSQSRVSLLEAISYTIKNRDFLILMAANLIIKITWFLAFSLTIYVNLYYVCGGDKSFAASVTGFNATTITLLGYVGLPMVTYFSKRFGKQAVLISCLVVALFSGFCSWWLYSPMSPYLQLATCIPLGIVLNGTWLLLATLVGDVCDQEEGVNQLRREGMYSGVFIAMDKIMFAIVSLGTGIILTLIGFDANAMPDERVVLNLRLAFVTVQVLGTGLAITLLVTLCKSKTVK